MTINPMPDDRYGRAAICRRGHPAAWDLDRVPTTSKFCDECGKPILRECQNCGARLQGSLRGVPSLSYSPPAFCDQCGAAHPWAGRTAKIERLRDQIESEDIDESEKGKLLQQLQSLDNPDASQEDEQRFAERLRRVAPAVWREGAPLLRDILSKVILQQ